jgi:hypothetical protein
MKKSIESTMHSYDPNVTGSKDQSTRGTSHKQDSAGNRLFSGSFIPDIALLQQDSLMNNI